MCPEVRHDAYRQGSFSRIANALIRSSELMDILSTGFVGTDSGSVASANAILLERLVRRGNRVRFFSKPSFVDPRELFSGHKNASLFEFSECTNSLTDGLRRIASPSGRGLWGRIWGGVDSSSYNRLLVQKMSKYSNSDLQLWLGDWARHRSNHPTVSFVQGCPGTDARSISKHRHLIAKLAGTTKFYQLEAYARYRLRWGLPSFRCSDQVLVGSEWSRRSLHRHYGVSLDKIHAIPYPIDLDSFSPNAGERSTRGPLQLLWLGRFVPRKRLDLFLAGLEIAIRNGCDVNAVVVGRSGFVPNYEKLIEEFAFPDRIEHHPYVKRTSVPTLIRESDVMCQPSDDEDFGSSVAEALACGVPAIVGATNGTADYICHRSIRLEDSHPETLASAISAMAESKSKGELADPTASRQIAEKHFSPDNVTDQLEKVLNLALEGNLSNVDA